MHCIRRRVKVIGTHFVQFSKLLALDAGTLIFRAVPVEDVHFYGFHAVEISPYDLEGNEMAGGIDHQTAPGETRLVLNRDRWRGKSIGRNIHELEKRL